MEYILRCAAHAFDGDGEDGDVNLGQLGEEDDEEIKFDDDGDASQALRFG